MPNFYAPRVTRPILKKRRWPFQARDVNRPPPPPPKDGPRKRVRFMDPYQDLEAEPLDIGALRDTLYSPYNGYDFPVVEIPERPVNCILEEFIAGQDFCQHDLSWQAMQTPRLRPIALPNDDPVVPPLGPHNFVVASSNGTLTPRSSNTSCTPCTPLPAPSVLIHELINGHRLLWDIREKPRNATTYSYHPDPSADVVHMRPDLDAPALHADIQIATITLSNRRLLPYMQAWGPISVQSSGAEPILLKDVLKAIFEYFNEQLTGEEIARCTVNSSFTRKIHAVHTARLLHTGRPGRSDPYRRIDLLEDLFKFRHLTVEAVSGYQCVLRLRLRKL